MPLALLVITVGMPPSLVTLPIDGEERVGATPASETAALRKALVMARLRRLRRIRRYQSETIPLAVVVVVGLPTLLANT